MVVCPLRRFFNRCVFWMKLCRGRGASWAMIGVAARLLQGGFGVGDSGYIGFFASC